MRTIGDNTRQNISEIADFVRTIGGYVNKTIDFFANFKENISRLTVDVMAWTYETLTKVVLHTPSFLFDSEWLKENTVTFTGLSLVMMVSLVLLEGFERLIGGMRSTRHLTPISQIYKRIPIVLAVSALAPTFFYYGFQGLNWLTDVIIGFSGDFMKYGLNATTLLDMSVYEILLFALFDIALIGMLVPVFFQNFRRWFELLVLTSITPLALSCWMFKTKEHLFNVWWSAIKSRAMVQLVYAVYLLFIGTIMFGTKVPENGMELLIKLGVMIGGLAAMANPPHIVGRLVNYRGRTEDTLNDAKNSLTIHEDVRGGMVELFKFAKKHLTGKRGSRRTKVT